MNARRQPKREPQEANNGAPILKEYDIPKEAFEKFAKRKLDKIKSIAHKRIVMAEIEKIPVMWSRGDVKKQKDHYKTVAHETYRRTGLVFQTRQILGLFKQLKDVLRTKLRKFITESPLETEAKLREWDQYPLIRFFRPNMEAFEAKIRGEQQVVVNDVVMNEDEEEEAKGNVADDGNVEEVWMEDLEDLPVEQGSPAAHHAAVKHEVVDRDDFADHQSAARPVEVKPFRAPQVLARQPCHPPQQPAAQHNPRQPDDIADNHRLEAPIAVAQQPEAHPVEVKPFRAPPQVVEVQQSRNPVVSRAQGYYQWPQREPELRMTEAELEEDMKEYFRRNEPRPIKQEPREPEEDEFRPKRFSIFPWRLQEGFQTRPLEPRESEELQPNRQEPRERHVLEPRRQEALEPRQREPNPEEPRPQGTFKPIKQEPREPEEEEFQPRRQEIFPGRQREAFEPNLQEPNHREPRQRDQFQPGPSEDLQPNSVQLPASLPTQPHLPHHHILGRPPRTQRDPLMLVSPLVNELPEHIWKQYEASMHCLNETAVELMASPDQDFQQVLQEKLRQRGY